MLSLHDLPNLCLTCDTNATSRFKIFKKKLEKKAFLLWQLSRRGSSKFHFRFHFLCLRHSITLLWRSCLAFRLSGCFAFRFGICLRFLVKFVVSAWIYRGWTCDVGMTKLDPGEEDSPCGMRIHETQKRPGHRTNPPYRAHTPQIDDLRYCRNPELVPREITRFPLSIHLLNGTPHGIARSFHY